MKLYKERTQDDQKGFPSDRRYWETIVPVCHFEDDCLIAIDIHPVSLGLGEKRHLRGRPRLALSQNAGEILDRFARLSEVFDTALKTDGRSARWSG